MKVVCDLIRSTANDDCMACVVPTLRSGAEVDRWAEDIDQFTLSFIAREQDIGISIGSWGADTEYERAASGIGFKESHISDLAIGLGGAFRHREIDTYPHWAPTTMVIVMVSSLQIN